jgi:hypothetical protein
MGSDVFVTGDYTRMQFSRMQKRGELVRVHPGIYVTAGVPKAEAIRREWLKVLGHLHPGAVVTDRSAPRVQPDDDDRIFIAIDHRPRAEQELPGLTIVAREGLPPQPSDTALPHGVYLASDGRALTENLIPRRASSKGVRRTLSDEELGDWLNRISDPRRVEQARAVAKDIAVAIGRPELASQAKRLLEASLGHQEVATASRQLRERSRGLPYDQGRVTMFRKLAEHLMDIEPPGVRSSGNPSIMAFYESYFSNFIEGTEFTLGEARSIVFGQGDPTNRPADAHDIRSVFNLINDSAWATAIPHTSDEFIQLLVDRHAIMMEERPEMLPGKFKALPNHVGARYFVSPGEVEGTLRQAFALIEKMDAPIKRGVLVHFVVAETHPFKDGNGRSARLMLNAEMEHADLARVIIPTAYRDNYLSGLKAMTTHGDPDPMTRALIATQKWTASIDWSTLEGAEQEIEATNGFLLPDEASELRRHLIIELDPLRIDVDTGPFKAAGTPSKKVLNRCPGTTNEGTRCKNQRWSGETCHAHHWISPWD